MVKAIIFDCFGVVIADTTRSAYESLGGDYVKDKAFILQANEASDKGIIPSAHPVLAERLGVSVPTYKTALSSGRIVNQQLLDYIESELKGEYTVAMLSNVGKGRLPVIFGEGFLEQYFEHIVASADIGYAKPEARAYEIAADRVGARLDECVFIDDRESYIEGAQHVGMKTVLYTDFKAFKQVLGALL